MVCITYVPHYAATVDSGEATGVPLFLLVNAVRTADGTWALPVPLAALLAWVWQRWEVEVRHRERKSGFGLGQQQAWSEAGTVATTLWVTRVYALVGLAGYQAWGYAVPGGTRIGGWRRPRRWALGMLWQQLRTELWGLADVQPILARSADRWAEMTAGTATHINASRGYRRIRAPLPHRSGPPAPGAQCSGPRQGGLACPN